MEYLTIDGAILVFTGLQKQQSSVSFPFIELVAVQERWLVRPAAGHGRAFGGVYMCVLCAEYAQFAKVVSIKSQRSEGQRISLKAKEIRFPFLSRNSEVVGFWSYARKVMEIGCYEQAQHGAQLRPPSWNSLLAVWDAKEISKLQIY